MENIYITKLWINKVRHLENINILLSTDKRKHLILTGKNGSGKTSVLIEIKNHIATIESGKLKALNRQMEVKNRVASAIRGESKILNRQLALNPEITISFNSDTKTLESSYDNYNFIIAFFDATRTTDFSVPSGIKKVYLKNKYKLEEQPGTQFVQHIVNLKADKSFARDDNDLETVNTIAENSLKEIFEDETLRLEFDRKNYNFNIIQKGRETYDFHTLSDGYAAILSIITELILRMENNKTKNYGLQGIVLIDEIEAHLHIELQKKVLPFLTKFFPKIQFIITTHSPFILNSIDDAVIYDLEKNLLINEDLSGYSYEGIVESYFDSDKLCEISHTKTQRSQRKDRKTLCHSVFFAALCDFFYITEKRQKGFVPLCVLCGSV